MPEAGRRGQFNPQDYPGVPYPKVVKPNATYRFVPKPPSDTKSLKRWKAVLRDLTGWGPDSLTTASLAFFKAVSNDLAETGASFVPFIGTFWLARDSAHVGFGSDYRPPMIRFRPHKALYRKLRYPIPDPEDHHECVKRGGKQEPKLSAYVMRKYKSEAAYRAKRNREYVERTQRIILGKTFDKDKC